MTAFDDPAEVAARVEALARPLLVATDVDGTISALAPTPEEARLVPGAVTALAGLATHPGVHVAVVSGRPRQVLLSQFGLPASLRLVGSHGAEPGLHGALEVPTVTDPRLLDAAAAWAPLVAATPGARLEHKPFGVALHLRGCTAADAARAEGVAGRMLASLGLTVHHGARVVEATASPATKAAALADLRRGVGAAAVVFLGDDPTDEAVFASLDRDDLGIRVGDGTTRATARLADPASVVAVLTAVASSSSAGV